MSDEKRIRQPTARLLEFKNMKKKVKRSRPASEFEQFGFSYSDSSKEGDAENVENTSCSHYESLRPMSFDEPSLIDEQRCFEILDSNSLESTSCQDQKPVYSMKEYVNANDATSNKKIYSVSKLLNEQNGVESDIDRLLTSLELGDIKQIGETIRRGIRLNSITDIQLAEVSKKSARTDVSYSSFVRDVEHSNVEDLKSLIVGQQFWVTLPTTDALRVSRLETHVSSIAAKQKKAEDFRLKINKQLEVPHKIYAEGPFPSKNLSQFYYRTSIIGTRAIDKMTDLYRKLFKELLVPSHRIWQYTFRPGNHRTGDCHFSPLPSNVCWALIDFGMDVIDSYLPPHVIPPDASLDDNFVQSLPYDDPAAVVLERRQNHKQAEELVKGAIFLSLRSLRTYHWSIDTGALISCSDCRHRSTHLRWEQVKTHRAACRNNGTDPDDWSPDDIIRQ